MNYTEFRANERNREALAHVRGCILKAASYTDPDTGLVIEPRPVDKSTRIQQMLELGRTDLGKWMHTGEMKKDAAFDWKALGNWAKDNYGTLGGSALGFLLGAMLGRSIGGRRYGLLGTLAGGALGALGGYYGGNYLQNNGALANGYARFRNWWDSMQKPAEPQEPVAHSELPTPQEPATVPSEKPLGI